MLKDRVLDIAITASLILHIFWLSVITVVITPKEANSVKFSRVSFLGPILQRGALEVRIEPRAQSFLETRYMLEIKEMISSEMPKVDRRDSDLSEIEEYGRPTKDHLTGLIQEALGTSKIRPAY